MRHFSYKSNPYTSPASKVRSLGVFTQIGNFQKFSELQYMVYCNTIKTQCVEEGIFVAASAKEFANLAYNLFEKNSIPYLRGGTGLTGMDSRGFIQYCLNQVGCPASYLGTNDMLRTAGKAEALSVQHLEPGMLLFRVDHDNSEPDRYKLDGRGNASYAAIYYASGKAVYPSEKHGGIIVVDPARHLNTMMRCKWLTYDLSQPATPAFTAYVCTANRGTLNLRNSRSEGKNILEKLPNQTQLTVLGQEDNWTQVIAPSGNKGWVKTEFIQKF